MYNDVKCYKDVKDLKEEIANYAENFNKKKWITIRKKIEGEKVIL